MRIHKTYADIKSIKTFLSQAAGHALHARPFEPYPKLVLGAVSSFLEPFRGHLSPKIKKIFENGLLIEVRRDWRGTDIRGRVTNRAA